MRQLPGDQMECSLDKVLVPLNKSTSSEWARRERLCLTYHVTSCTQFKEKKIDIKESLKSLDDWHKTVGMPLKKTPACFVLASIIEFAVIFF